jgi:hypothetical protein
MLFSLALLLLLPLLVGQNGASARQIKLLLFAIE